MHCEVFFSREAKVSEHVRAVVPADATVAVQRNSNSLQQIELCMAFHRNILLCPPKIYLQLRVKAG